MDMRRAPVIGAVGPGIGAGANGGEAVAAVACRQRAAAAAKIRIERRDVGFVDMSVAPAGVCLPDLDQAIGHTPALFIEHAAVDDDALANGRLSRTGKIGDEIAVLVANQIVAENGACEFGSRLRDHDQLLFRRTQDA